MSNTKWLIFLGVAFSILLLLSALFCIFLMRKIRKQKENRSLKKEILGQDNSTVESNKKPEKLTETLREEQYSKTITEILPISQMGEKEKAALQIETILQSLTEDDAAKLPMPIIEKYVDGDFLWHIDKVIRGFFKEGSVTVNGISRTIGAGYSQAAGYMDRLERAGIVGTKEYSDERQLMLTQEEYEKVLRRKMLNYPNILDDLTVSAIIKQLSTDMYLLHTHCLDDVDKMDGTEFEYWCADLLRKLGYRNVEVTKGSGDQGVDITAIKDDVRYGFQCKRHASDQGNTPIQEIYSGLRLYRLHVGVVITNQHFTPQAKELAAATCVILWDRDWLKLTLRKLYEDEETKGDL